MKKIILSIAAVATMGTSVAVSAQQSDLYGEVGFAALKIKDESGTLGSFDNTAVKFTLGKVVANNIALEAMIGTGMSDDSKVISGVNVSVETKEYYGAFVRPFAKINDDFEVFARVGYFHGKLRATASNGVASASISDSGGDIAYGVGAAYNITKTTALVVDYMNYYDKEDTKVNGFGLGLRYKF